MGGSQVLGYYDESTWFESPGTCGPDGTCFPGMWFEYRYSVEYQYYSAYYLQD